MSRSNPSQNDPNPATRFFEWNGETGLIRYYDKAAKQNVEVKLPFTFLLLDELACVRGWHEASKSGIYSNEVRDTRTDIMVVKSFKGGTLSEGLYRDIKDRVNLMGGDFTANCYIAYKQDAGLAIGALQFKGAALGAWMEFRKAHRGELYDKAVTVVGFNEGKKGKVVFRVPTFELKGTSEATNAAAVELDQQLQKWLTGYLSRKTSDKAEAAQVDMPPQPEDDFTSGDVQDFVDSPDVDDIPF